MLVINLLHLSSEFTLFACSVKLYLGPVNILPYIEALLMRALNRIGILMIRKSGEEVCGWIALKGYRLGRYLCPYECLVKSIL
jgi:hypothetical protein